MSQLPPELVVSAPHYIRRSKRYLYGEIITQDCYGSIDLHPFDANSNVTTILKNSTIHHDTDQSLPWIKWKMPRSNGILQRLFWGRTYPATGERLAHGIPVSPGHGKPGSPCNVAERQHPAVWN